MRYLVAKSNGLASYLGFGAEVVAAGPTASVVAVPDEHAEWLLQRLRSGMMVLGWPGWPALEEARRWAAEENGKTPCTNR